MSEFRHSKRHELIDTLSEERGSTPEEERRIAHQEPGQSCQNAAVQPRPEMTGEARVTITRSYYIDPKMQLEESN